MEWRDCGIVLAARRHGESSLVVTLLTAERGRWSGLARGGGRKGVLVVYQPGNVLLANWTARLEEQLGRLVCEPVDMLAADLLRAPPRLSALASACALVNASMPDRVPATGVYDATLALLTALRMADHLASYALWELEMLGEIGYGLDLERCAATGRSDNLAYVSPRSGRAVSETSGAPYCARLLPLPAFLRGATAEPPMNADIVSALMLTGFFLQKRVFGSRRPLPAARRRLLQSLTSVPAAERGGG